MESCFSSHLLPTTPRLLDAVISRDVAAVKSCLQRGDDPNTRSPLGLNSLQMICWANDGLLSRQRTEWLQIADALIDAGCHVNHRNFLGGTPMHSVIGAIGSATVAGEPRVTASKISVLKSLLALYLRRQGDPNAVDTDGNALIGMAIRQTCRSQFGLNTSLRLVKLLVYYGGDVSLPACNYEHRDIHALELFFTCHGPYIKPANCQELMALVSCIPAFLSLPRSPWVAFNVKQCSLEYLLKVGLLFYSPAAFTLIDFVGKFQQNAPKAAFSDWLVDLSPSDLSRSDLPHEESVYFTLQKATFSLRHLTRRAVRRRLFSRRYRLPNAQQINGELERFIGPNLQLFW